MTGRQLNNVVKLFSSFGIKEITPRLCDKNNVPFSNPAFNESKSAAPIRSKKTHKVIEFFCETIVAGSLVILETA